MKKWNELPVEIQKKMLEYQFKEDGKNDVSAFEGCITGGFIFENTPEGYDFWEQVLQHNNEWLFYKHYPKKTFPREMIVWDKEDEKERRLVIADFGKEYNRRYVVDGLYLFDGKKCKESFYFAEEIEEKVDEPQRCFILTFQIIGKHEMFSYEVKLPAFPTFKRCIEIGQEEAIREGFVGKVFLLGITELSKEDFETFLSEIQ